MFFGFSALGLKGEFDKFKRKWVLSHFLKAFCKWWEQHGGLDSREAKADFISIIILLQEDMAEIEAMHASVRRELYVLSVQTHTVLFEELSNRYTLRCARRHPKAYGVNPYKLKRKAETTNDDEPPDEPRENRKRTSAFRLYLSDATVGTKTGCAQLGSGDAFKNLSPSEREALDNRLPNVREAIRLGGGDGYAKSKRDVEAAAKREQRDAELERMKTAQQIDPTATCASALLDTTALDEYVQFIDGIRTLRRRIRAANAADNAAIANQDDVLEAHDKSSRQLDGRINGLPTEISSILGEDWRLPPHKFTTTLKHVRGSFPIVAGMASKVCTTNLKTPFGVAVCRKLAILQEHLHRPALHNEAPTVSKDEAKQVDSDCGRAGFCVHGADGHSLISMRSNLLGGFCRRFSNER